MSNNGEKIGMNLATPKPVERGPNYDWQHEAKHYQDEANELRELCRKLENSWELEADALETRVKELRLALINIKEELGRNGSSDSNDFHIAEIIEVALGEKK